MKILAVLGRQPKISIAELEALGFCPKAVALNLAIFEAEKVPEIDSLGGCLKLARLIEGPVMDYLMGLPEGKITLGVSEIGQKGGAKKAWAEAMRLKKALGRQGRKVRILENKEGMISSVTAHHNQIGENPRRVELIIAAGEVWTVFGVQNISAYAKRDQKRPARDARVGMLPPKLAQILINLCGELPKGARVLDPFCGTGVVLQEAYLMGYRPYGSDLNPRMVEYSRKNLAWLTKDNDYDIIEGDATNFNWNLPISAVATEIYLGPPMSQPPVGMKLKAAKQECGGILLSTLKNLAKQLTPGTPLALAVPAWLRPDGSYERLNLLDEIANLGYNVSEFNNLSQSDLLYHREGQVVAREIIVLRKK